MSNSFCSYGGAAFTNNSNEWRTPAWLFNELDNEFHFELDAAASDDNHLCERYFTKDLDGLSQEWDGNVFCNPPYGREIGKWCEKAATTHGGGVIVLLIPARTETSYWRKWVFPYATEIRFVMGRLKFNDGKESAPFPSAVIIYDDREKWYVRCTATRTLNV